MAIDDTVKATREHLELEKLSESPLMDHMEYVMRVVSFLQNLFHLHAPTDAAVGTIRGFLSARENEKIKLLQNAFELELGRLGGKVELIMTSEKFTGDELREQQRFIELSLDAYRRAANTRSDERVKRIAAILASACLSPTESDGDTAEEMMRIAQELSDRDVMFLGELVRIEGQAVRKLDRVHRLHAYEWWEKGWWGRQIDPELDSVFSKLESYGLVSRLPPPNNLNMIGDYQHRYVLLPKGLKFVDLIGSFASKDSS